MKQTIKSILDAEFLNKNYNTSSLMQRGVGDIIETKIANFLLSYESTNFIVEEATSKRSIEDVKLTKGKEVYFIDVKTHDVDSDFSMPNLVSIDRIRKTLPNKDNFILYVFVDYKTTDNITQIIDIKVFYIEDLDWSILSIANLGLGQLQIKDANKSLQFTQIGRDAWLAVLKSNALSYYDKQKEKIDEYKKLW
jgi:hypothetical protein